MYNGKAVFLGDKPWHYRDGAEGLVARVIAFEAPSGPPMDITVQILKRWCAQSGVALTNVMQNTLVDLTQTNGVLHLGFGIIKRGLRGPGTIDTDDGTATITWDEIRQMMEEARKDGKLKKTKRPALNI